MERRGAVTGGFRLIDAFTGQTNHMAYPAAAVLPDAAQ
jgi:hypothetical protein